MAHPPARCRVLALCLLVAVVAPVAGCSEDSPSGEVPRDPVPEGTK